MKNIKVKVKGASNYGILMNRFTALDAAKVAEGGGTVTMPGVKKGDSQGEAEAGCYRLAPVGKGKKKGNLYIPAENFRQALINGAAYEKGRGRSNLSKIASASIFVNPAALDLGTNEFSIDTRAVVNPFTKGRQVKNRAYLPEWEVEMILQFDEELVSEAQLRAIVDHTGGKVGVLDFRPAKKGPFGRFTVIGWEPVDEAGNPLAEEEAA